MAFNLLRRLVRHLDRVELNTDIALIIHLAEFSKCFRARWDDNLAIPLIVVLNGSYPTTGVLTAELTGVCSRAISRVPVGSAMNSGFRSITTGCTLLEVCVG